jgi:hypothetical protein
MGSLQVNILVAFFIKVRIYFIWKFGLYFDINLGLEIPVTVASLDSDSVLILGKAL